VQRLSGLDVALDLDVDGAVQQREPADLLVRVDPGSEQLVQSRQVLQRAVAASWAGVSSSVPYLPLIR